jgi:hypothetical protein
MVLALMVIVNFQQKTTKQNKFSGYPLKIQKKKKNLFVQ